MRRLFVNEVLYFFILTYKSTKVNTEIKKFLHSSNYKKNRSKKCTFWDGSFFLKNLCQKVRF